MPKDEVEAMNNYLGRIWEDTKFNRACADYQKFYGSMEMALKELRDRCNYFFAKTDGTYNPPPVKDFIKIIDLALQGKYYCN